MTIDLAHILLGINQDISLNDIAKKYLDYKQNNHDISYIEWLEQEVVIKDKCLKLGMSEDELFNIISRENIINNYYQKQRVYK